MNIRFPLYFLLSLLLAGVAASCNDNNDPGSVTINSYVNCEVSSFSLMRNDSVLTRLDSVFFAIDLMKAEIYNADSLPVGTRVSALRIKVGTESASACNITFRLRGTDRDTTINYIDSPNDSINFADGPVKMEIVSYNAQARRTYTVRVNVHKSVPDTLVWDRSDIAPLPTTLSAIKAEKTVEMGGKIYVFTTDGSAVKMAVVDNPYDMTYVCHDVQMPARMDVGSIAAGDDTFYCLDSDGNLSTSEDGLQWTAAGVRMDYLYGGYGKRVLGARNDGGRWMHVTYPATDEAPVPAGCPVAATSQLVSFTGKWNISPTAIMLGGIDAEGRLTGSAWAYDGTRWGLLSNSPIPPMAGVTIFPYKTVRINYSNWSVTEQASVIAMGGYSTAGGKTVANDTVYVSRDYGITWTKAAKTLQLPEWMPRAAGSYAAVANQTLRRPAAAEARVIAPVDEWECPYIYLFGGTLTDGTTVTDVRRGVINRFTFIPVY